jgi:hypothetical protein
MGRRLITDASLIFAKMVAYSVRFPALSCSRRCDTMDDRIAELEGAIRAQAALIRSAQEEVINHVSAKIGILEFADRIIRLLDGPRQRTVQRQARDALGDEEPHDFDLN